MGQDDFNSGASVMLMRIGTIALSIVSGVLAWDWVEPKSFLSAIGFLIVWGIFSKIGYYLMLGVIFLIFDNNKITMDDKNRKLTIIICIMFFILTALSFNIYQQRKIKKLRSDRDYCQNEKDNLEKELDECKSQKDNYEDKVNNQSSDKSSLESEKDDLESKVKNLEGVLYDCQRKLGDCN